MAKLPTQARIRLWVGVFLGVILGIAAWQAMESWVYGIIIGMLAAVVLGSRWAKTAMKK